MSTEKIKDMSFGEALSIVLAIAIAGRAMGETNSRVSEDDIDNAIAIVQDKADRLVKMGGPKGPRK
jgi:hypothetical protein